VWGDSSSWLNVKSTGPNQFILRAGGGMILTPRSGALNPAAQLHIPFSSSLLRPHLFLQQVPGTDSYARLRFADTANSTTQFWDVAAQPGAFNIYYRGDQQDILRLLPDDATNLLFMRNGARLTNGGAWTNGSDRETKSNFAAVDSRQVLERVAAMPIQTWNYRSEPETSRHMGPTAQDFYAAFSLGDSDKCISTVDADGVALAAIQGLSQIVREKDAEIKAQQRHISGLESDRAAQQQEINTLKERNDAMETRLAALESVMNRLAQNPSSARSQNGEQGR